MNNSLETQGKVKHTYTREMLIKNIAKMCDENMSTIRNIYNLLEQNVARLLSDANPDTDISIRLFEGITINSTFIPEKTKVNNLTGEVITSTSKIKPKANITRSYCEKLTNRNK